MTVGAATSKLNFGATTPAALSNGLEPIDQISSNLLKIFGQLESKLNTLEGARASTETLVRTSIVHDLKADQPNGRLNCKMAARGAAVLHKYTTMG